MQEISGYALIEMMWRCTISMEYITSRRILSPKGLRVGKLHLLSCQMSGPL
jgi:hypothetical protein